MKKLLLIAGAMLAATPALAAASSSSDGANVTAGIVIMVLLVGYFLPTIVAQNRGHHQKGAILVLNLAFGWTVLGWIAALIWANTAVVRRNQDGTIG